MARLVCLSRGVTVGWSHTVNRVQALTRRVTADHAAHAPGCSRRDFVVYAPRLVSTQKFVSALRPGPFSRLRYFSHEACRQIALPLRPAQCSKHRAADVQCRCTGMVVGSCVRPMHNKGSPLAGSPAIEPRTNYLSRSVRPAPPYVCRANERRDHSWDHCPRVIISRNNTGTEPIRACSPDVPGWQMNVNVNVLPGN